MNKNDLRAQRTFHKINKHFKILMSTVGYDKLNVAMITDKAKMNRSTFYSHFKDKRELYEYHLGLIIDSFDFYSLFDIVKRPFNDLSDKEQNALVKNMSTALKKMHDEKDFILAMLKVEDVAGLSQTYIAHLGKDFEKRRDSLRFQQGNISVPADLIVTFGVGMFVSVIEWWLVQEPHISAVEIGKILLNIFYSIPLTIEQPAV